MGDEPVEIEMVDMQVGTRDPEATREILVPWLSGHLPDAVTPPKVSGFGTTAANGMSSETVLFEVEWDDGSLTHTEDLVARIAPDHDNQPVFASYDLGMQFEVLRLVRELTDVPVPRVRWLEATDALIGSPFFVMDRVAGVVPLSLIHI